MGNFRILISVLAGVGSVQAQWFSSSEEGKEDDECSLYLAPSPLFEQHLGVYTTKPLGKGAKIEGVSDAVIPLVEDYDPLWSHNDWTHLTSSVEWEGRDINALLIGVGSASAENKNTHISNMISMLDSVEVDSVGLHRHKDSGSGAFAHQRLSYKVTSAIPAGGQLILNTMNEDYELDEEEVDHLKSTIEHTKSLISGQPSDVAKDLIRIIRSAMDPPSRDYFPASLKQLLRFENGGIEATWRADDLKADIPYLKENGQCLDNLRIAPSNIPQAGRGAFAKRIISADSVITPVPVIPVAKKDLKIDFEDSANNTKMDYQLLMNYCIGYVESSIMLCPYGSSFPYVNHGTGENVNAKLQWSTKMSSKQEELSKLSARDVLSHPSTGLVLELVALRDIKVGEEVIIDYGAVWEKSWNEHQKNWNAPADEEAYQSATQMNRETRQLRTEEEQEKDPYLDHVYIAMRYPYDPEAIPESSQMDEDESMLTKTFKYSSQQETSSESLLRPVSLLQRKTSTFGSEIYTVTLHNYFNDQGNEVHAIREDRETVQLTGVPRGSLFFVDDMFSTDIHQPNVFRQAIGATSVPYPISWLDSVPLAEETEESYNVVEPEL